MTERSSGERDRGEPAVTDPVVAEPAARDSAVARSAESETTASGTAPKRTAARGWRRISAGPIIGLLVGLLAFALVVQLKSSGGDQQLENLRQDDLVRILSDLDAREQRLRAEIASLEQTLSRLGEGEEGRQAALAEARRRADELGILAGTLPARGEGLVIRLVPAADRPIRAATVLEAVEELRGAGAEAMQIEGAYGSPVRIVASTYFVDRDNGMVVDGQEMVGGYTITVVGPAATMRTALTIPGGVSDAMARDGGTVAVEEPGTVSVSAIRTPDDLEYARPVT